MTNKLFTRLVVLFKMNKQIKTKKRVADHGEVFTSDREVNNMLDLVLDESERIESRFLEPACGTGNFLKIVLERKLKKVEQYKKNKSEFEKYIFVTACSLYGIDILNDNVVECRENLFNIIYKFYSSQFGNKNNNEFFKVIKFILSKNIRCADALTMKDINGNPIVLSEWSLVTGNKIKRRDYKYSELIMNDNGKVLKDEERIFIPEPVKEYPLLQYMKVVEYE